MKTILFLCSSVLIFMLAVLDTTDTPAIDSNCKDTAVSFKHDVFPIIEENCLPCHLQEERNMSRLFMDNYNLLMKGGFNGPPIKPGNAEESLLIKKVSPDPPFGERMPLRSKNYLTDDEIAIITQWIDEGAEDN